MKNIKIEQYREIENTWRSMRERKRRDCTFDNCTQKGLGRV